MRSDSIGMFWEDIQEPGRRKIARVMPPIPDTGWRPPTYYPNLEKAKYLAIDTETFDPELKLRGPGWGRGKGHIVGFSVATDDLHKWYFPIRHEIEPEDNLDPVATLRWLSDILSNKNQPKIGANLLYDIGWLRHEGVTTQGPLYDVQFAGALLDETLSVDLDSLSQRYLGASKETNLLYQWCSDYYGGPVTGEQRKNLYRAPPRLVGPYGESDATLPVQLLPVLWKKLDEENLLKVFDMECRLIPMLIEMREAGVQVNLDAANQLRDKLEEEEKKEHAKLNDLVGQKVEISAAASLAKAFDKLGLDYPKTKKGNPSFTKGFLGTVKHPIGDYLNNIRKLAKLRGTFVEGYILNSNVDGRVFCQFHPLRGIEGGTRSGRFSSSTPNLQNIPARDEELAPLVRGLFTPDEDHVAWRKYDYSQIEYRFLVHYASGPGAEEIRQLYKENADADYHAITQREVKSMTGVELDRRHAKNINFGLIYGMGDKTLASNLGLPLGKARELFAAYHKGTPFVKDTMDATMEEARQLGMITTILGRRSRFNLWEPIGWGNDTVALPYEKAILSYGQIQRAYIHKALNRRLQGSAADMMKVAMLQCWEDGVFDETGIPRLTVHDELDFSDPGGKDEAFKEMSRIMETALAISIPVKVDCEIGPDWGHVKDQ